MDAITSKSRMVLGVDDDSIFNYLTRRCFENAGVNCELRFLTTVEDAIRYLDDAENSFPDLILVDINMPKLTGWDFLELYEKKGFGKNRKTVIIMLSTSVYMEDREKAISYPYVRDYIEKPLTIDQIHEIRTKYLL